jgi:hypothetical protein
MSQQVSKIVDQYMASMPYSGADNIHYGKKCRPRRILFLKTKLPEPNSTAKG